MGSSPLLSLVWREACRHVELADCAANVTRQLVKSMPVAQLLVRRLDAGRACVETVAWGLKRIESLGDNVQAELSPRTVKRLLDWCRTGRAVLLRPSKRLEAHLAFLNDVASHSSDADAIVGPLAGHHGITGLLVLYAAPAERFTAEHQRIAQSLLEPFTVALENDRRLHELLELREAAEAEKRSLLTRLGRQEIADAIVGADAGLGPVMQRVALVRRSDVPVLILGETGSGKEVIARAIHTGSNRSAKPFIRVNCGAIPPELIDSELFGHEKGSFTGATATRRGWFERADGGTLLLDEIGELPRAAQVRLLRIVQDGTLNRVGAENPLRVDVRIIAATHRDLPAMVQNGAFREDLWYRIAIFPIVLPPLRERSGDIPTLAEHFARRAATRFGLKLQLPTLQDMELLIRYTWPGNVRELQTVMDRAAILGEGERLEIARALGVGSIAPAALSIPPAPRPVSDPTVDPYPQQPTPIESLDQAMKRHVEMTLRTTYGRIEGPHGAARILGINPHTLRARMRKLHIDWASYRISGKTIN